MLFVVLVWLIHVVILVVVCVVGRSLRVVAKHVVVVVHALMVAAIHVLTVVAAAIHVLTVVAVAIHVLAAAAVVVLGQCCGSGGRASASGCRCSRVGPNGSYNDSRCADGGGSRVRRSYNDYGDSGGLM